MVALRKQSYLAHQITGVRLSVSVRILQTVDRRAMKLSLRPK